MYTFLVRHGRTRWNEEGRLQGLADLPVSEGGQKETLQAVRFLRRFPVRRIWTSPLQRCRSLAETLAAEVNAPCEVDDLLREQAFGKWEGKTATEVASVDPELWRQYLADRPHTRPPGGETYEEVAERARQVRKRLTDGVVLVSHYNLLMALLEQLLELPLGALLDFPFPPGSVWRVTGNPHLTAFPVFRPEDGLWYYV